MQNEVSSSDISQLLHRARDNYVRTNPKSQAAFERACQSLPGGNTRSVLYHEPFPMTFDSAQDCHVTSIDGDKYLDFVSEYSAALFGHSHPEIKRAISEAMDRGLNFGGHNDKEVELAEHIVHRFKSIEMVRFCNSGTEANTLAIAVAKAYTRRSKILIFKHGYHGGTLTFHELHNPMNLPHEYVMGEFNDVEATRRVLSYDIAAMIVEPMQGAGGMIPSSTEFLRFLRKSATEIGAVLIFDEVITSRLHINGMQAYYDIYPDMTTLGNYVGGGFSFGAFGGRKDIMQKLDPRVTEAEGGLPHSGTYNNNLFSMTAGLAASKLITTDAISNLNMLGNRLRDAIQEALDERQVHHIQTTGFGSLIGIHFSGPDANDLRDCFYFHMLRSRIYLGKRGFINLNFMHGLEHIDLILDAILDFVKLLSL